jgi:RNA polymerase sigma-70 factor (ECF subfamily)
MVSNAQFERLVMPHRNAAFNLAYWILQNRDEAEDAVQEAYLRAFRGFAGFNGGAVRSWLLAIVRNVAYSALANRKRLNQIVASNEDLEGRTGGGIEEIASTEPSPETLAIAQCERRELLSALAELPLIYRDAVVLREMEGLSYSEIAEIVGVPIGTVMSRLARGRAELRKALGRQTG